MITLPVNDPVLIVAIAMAAFLLMPLLTNKLRLPDIIGILVAGIIVGPHGLGLLERDDTIVLLGTVGLLYLVFLAGLEVDLGDLSRKRNRAVSFGALTFLVPQILGTLGGWYFFDFNWPTAILLGSVFSSHSFLALLIAKRLGLTDREMTVAVIGGTVITDTLALLVLAVVAQSTSGEFGISFLLSLLFQAGLFSVAVVVLIPLLGRWFFRRINDGGAHFAFMMTVLFTCGYLAHVVKLEPIIGAFLAGLAMNRLVPHQGVLANRAFFVGNTIFVPFFLLSVGMMIDLKMVVSDQRTIEMAVFMTLAVILCKGGAAWLMRVIFGYGKEDAVVAWGLSLPQAATTLAVVLVGYEELGLFDEAVLNATIVMVLVTCMLGPILVQAAGRRIASAAEAAADDADSSDMEDLEPSAFQRILIPLSNPQSSENLLDFASTLRRPLNDEPLLPTSVASRDTQVATSERLLGASIVHMAGAEVPVTPVIRVDLNPVNGILRAYTESRATSMVVGWSGPESHWQRHFHLNRGVIDDLIEATTGQLWVVRLTEPVSVIEDVIFVLPGSAYSETNFAELASDIKLLAKRCGGKLTIVTRQALSQGQQDRLTKLGATCTLQFVVAENGETTAIDAIVNVKTLLCVFGCREGTLSWNSAWARQMTSLAHHYRHISFIAAYPRLDAQPLTQTYVRKPDQAGFIRQAHISVEANEPLSVAALINDHVATRVTLSADVLKHLEEGMSALNGKVALVHASTPTIQRTQLTMIIVPQGLNYQQLTIQIVLVLLNPVGTEAAHHLARLAAMARVFSSLQRIDHIVQHHDDIPTIRRLLADRKA